MQRSAGDSELTRLGLGALVTDDPLAAAYRNLAAAGFAGLILVAGLLWGFSVSPVMGAVMAVALLGGGWTLFALHRPLPAFLAVFFVFVTAYARLNFGAVPVAGPLTTNRGAITLGDLMWIGLAAAALIRWGFLRGAAPTRWLLEAAETPRLWLLVPFAALAIALPLVGYLAGDWPASYAVPGFRQFQWIGFALMAYLLVRERGAVPVVRGLFAVLLAAALLHFAYALVQLAYALDLVGRIWVAWDDLYRAQHNVGWFFYPRLTGLLVNPNAYGIFGAFILVAGAALALARAASGVRIGVLLATAAFAIALSGSRSALLGLGIAAILAGFAAMRSDRIATRLLKVATVAPLIGFGFGILAWPLIPGILQRRFQRFASVLTEGAGADMNAILRVEMWQTALATYWAEHPLGTWVPSSFALNLPIDSYYVYTTVQGTPAYTLLWLLFMGGAAALGWRAWAWSGSALEGAAGLALIGWVAVLLGASITLSPFLQPHLAAPFWVLIGVAAAIVCAPKAETGRPCTP